MTTLSLSELEASKLSFELDQTSHLINAYKEDLQNFIANTADVDSVAKNYFINTLVDKWQAYLGFNKMQVMQDIADMQTPVTDTVKSLTLKEALQYYSDSASWLVPNILRSSGLYILAGEPKTGKSLLLYFLMYAVSVSGKFLGRPVKKGKVLYIQLEESLSTIAERLFFCGFGDVFDDETSLSVNFGDTLCVEREFDITLDLDWLIRRIEEYQPSLVVIDSLRMASINSPFSENSNEFGKLVYRLQKVFNHTNTCGVLVHHMNKAGGRNVKTTSLIERLSGHTSISAASSGLLGIYREETEQGPLIFLRTAPRDGTSITLTYCLKTAANGMWMLEKIWEDTPIGDPITGKILRFLYQHYSESGEEVSFSDRDIAFALNMSASQADFKKCLEFLTVSQLIGSKYRSGSFTYFLPPENEWLVNSPSIKDSLDSSVIDANSVIRCQDKRDLQRLFKDWERERINRAIAYLLPEEKEKVDVLATTPYFQTDDVVVYQEKVYQVLELVSPKVSLYRTVYKIGNETEEVEALETDLELAQEVQSEPTVDQAYELDMDELVFESPTPEQVESVLELGDEDGLDIEDLFSE